jgi:hypothetical protein
MKLITINLLTIFFFLSACGGQSGVDSMAGGLGAIPSKEDAAAFFKNCNVSAFPNYDNPTTLAFLKAGAKPLCIDEESKVKYIAAFPTLTNVAFSADCVVGSGIQYLANLPNLRDLVINNNKVKGSGLIYLAGLSKLNNINLSNVNMNKADLDQLRDLPILQFLFLANTGLTTADGNNFNAYRAANGLGTVNISY